MAPRDGNVVASPARWLETGLRLNRLITLEAGRPAKIEIEYARHGSGQVQQIVLPQVTLLELRDRITAARSHNSATTATYELQFLADAAIALLRIGAFEDAAGRLPLDQFLKAAFSEIEAHGSQVLTGFRLARCDMLFTISGQIKSGKSSLTHKWHM
jgi:hypothetical protein